HRSLPLRSGVAAEIVNDFPNDGRLWLVRIISGVNELKKISIRGRTLDRHNPNPLMPNNNFVALVHIEELNGSRSASFSIKRDCAVDHCGPHFDFLTL